MQPVAVFSCLAAQAFRLARLLLLAGVCGSAGGQGADVLRIGVLAYLGADAAVEEWTPVTAQLRRALPGRAVELMSMDHAALNEAARTGQVDFIITNPGHYVELESGVGASRMLTLQTGPALPTSAWQAVGAAVVTLVGNPQIQRLADLRGQRVAVVGQQAFSGYQLVWRELAGEGIDPERDLRELKMVGLPMDRVLDAVASGAADAGFVRACMIESRPEWRERFRVVEPRPETGFACATSTRVYPNWPIASLRHTDPALARAVTIALLEMRAGDSPISWTVPADYQSVHDLQRELKIGPYADLRVPTLTALAQRYWPWLAGLLGLIALGGIYTLHVERQVQARTAALRQAAREREELEAHLRQSREQAEHMARLSVLGELSGTLAHELNQPLAAIGNYAHSLIRRIDNQRLSPEAAREAASEMAGQAERAAGVLGRIRAFARKRVAQRQTVDPVLLVHEAVALFRGMQVQAPPVDVVNALPRDTRLSVDALQVQQVLLNLLKNGWDATRDLPRDRQRLTVALHRDADGVHIAVRDRGEALSPGQQSRLFEPFFTTKTDGLGLGLSICRSIAEAHGGRLDAAPLADGPGLQITLTLPHDDRHPARIR
jgi:two-component system sensor histidine kinase TtrS